MPTPNPQPPIPLALITCDQVIQEQDTGKMSLIGIFTMINAVRFPCVHPRMGFFLSLTEVYATIPLVIRLIDASDESVLIEYQGELACKDPRDSADFGANLPMVKFPRAGLYLLQVLSQENIIIEKRVITNLISPPAQ